MVPGRDVMQHATTKSSSNKVQQTHTIRIVPGQSPTMRTQGGTGSKAISVATGERSGGIRVSGHTPPNGSGGPSESDRTEVPITTV